MKLCDGPEACCLTTPAHAAHGVKRAQMLALPPKRHPRWQALLRRVSERPRALQALQTEGPAR